MRPVPVRPLRLGWFLATNRITAGAQPVHSASGARRATVVAMSTPKQQVLVVDDEASIVDAVATALRYEGFEVREAISGRAALAAAQEDPPDLVVLDVMLPDLDGLEVTRR